ncbi:hypothetical protein A3Q56_06382 [Intoshia linei]|uniref:Mediator of RNA polymerase II transcription subunit 19 n=1 Tax=Intoshia linei TaxID=1819745 RepID=A0A177AWZ6_9BILA|nr:hypothetical protein A3Q56_06382 [Intoshia linei]
MTDCKITCSSNLLKIQNMEDSYNQVFQNKIEENLSVYLKDIPKLELENNMKSTHLINLIENPPIVSRSIVPFVEDNMKGFKLHSGKL